MSSVTLKEFIETLSQNKRRALASVRTTAYRDFVNLTEEMKLRSPLDSGFFRKNWELKERGSNSVKLANFRVQNRTFYGSFLDEGVPPGGVPWYWPNAKNPGPISKSGKLALINGRVWAGGKSPSGFVEGGIVDRVIFYNHKRQLEMADRVANAFVEAL